MKKWETFQVKSDDVSAETLNDLGEQGWEPAFADKWGNVWLKREVISFNDGSSEPMP